MKQLALSTAFMAVAIMFGSLVAWAAWGMFVEGINRPDLHVDYASAFWLVVGARFAYKAIVGRFVVEVEHG